eukprot:TRINITY_DN11052_c0_g1_i1.p1 TRINITY_DN11052_c0_g1~~TRINITY_DN11052_c0_g1_i1.p1  ORF type:complete len:386 (-),score=68.81 TRINITY_DN11052_c0_g1_i1:124-1221(-)
MALTFASLRSPNALQASMPVAAPLRYASDVHVLIESEKRFTGAVNVVSSSTSARIAAAAVATAGFCSAFHSKQSRRSRQFHSAPRVACRALTDEKNLSVSSLLEKYGKDISAIRKACGDMVEDRDDSYLLRFAIEHKGDVDAAVKNVGQVNLWRRRAGKPIIEAAAGAVAKAMEGGKWDNSHVLAAAPHSAAISKFITGSQIVIVTMPNGDLCSCIRASAIDDKSLMDNVTVEQMTDFFLYCREVNFLVAEQRTRSSGMLCRLIAANDLTGVSKLPDSRFQKSLTESSAQATQLYPGFAGPTAILNIPTLARFLLTFLAPLFPGSVQQRLKFAKSSMSYIDDLTDICKDPCKSRFTTDLTAVLTA